MKEETEQVCPWWMGYLLLFPLRKLSQNPVKITGPYLKPGMKVLDYGSAMGFFSLPMAKLVGPEGKVYCADVQQKMLDKLMARADKAKLNNINPRLLETGEELKDLMDTVDFCLLFAVVHEVPDKERLFATLNQLLKRDGKILFAEPPGHVSEKDFSFSIQIAKANGFKVSGIPDLSKSRTVLLEKTN